MDNDSAMNAAGEGGALAGRQPPLPEPHPAASRDEDTAFKVLVAVSLAHFLNDATQSLLLPTYPLLKDAFLLTFTQLGLITLTYQLTASLLQPLVGYLADKRPMPYTLSVGMGFTLTGLLFLAFAPSYAWIIVGAMVLGTGSSIFHPESSRVARMASGGRFGLAQSIFQVGGNLGTSCGPLLAAAVVITHGRSSIGWFALFPLTGFFLLLWVGGWAKGRIPHKKHPKHAPAAVLSRGTLIRSFAILLILVFSKDFYTAGIFNYFIFYLTDAFDISLESAQIRLFVYLFAVGLGTLLGGPIGDRIGRKYVIWGSIFGAAPFTIALPHLDLFWTTAFAFCAGFIIGSSMAAIIVFAQELLPNRIGMVSGLFFGLSFGLGGIGAAVLGKLTDLHGIRQVYLLCSFLPLLGIAAVFLPNIHQNKRRP